MRRLKCGGKGNLSTNFITNASDNADANDEKGLLQVLIGQSFDVHCTPTHSHKQEWRDEAVAVHRPSRDKSKQSY